MKKKFLLFIIQSIVVNAFSQNVGIGTNSPSEKLEVIGNVKGDTLKSNTIKIPINAGAGKVLTSDATGTASWQAAVANTSAINGLKKINNNIGLGGMLSEHTVLRINSKDLLFTDTSQSYFQIIGQSLFPDALPLSSIPVWQNFYNYGLFSINRIEVYVAAFGGSAITAELKDNAGNILATATNNYGSIFNNWSSFNFPVISLQPDSVYRVFLTATGTTQVHYATGNPYTESCSIGIDADIAFRVFGADDNYTMHLAGNKVGINTINPTANLDVAGSLRIRNGSEGTGRILFSDAAGNATWQSMTSPTVGGWGTNGNTGTTGTNFIGTTDNQPLVFKTNNIQSGLFNHSNRNYFIGQNAGGGITTGTGSIAIGQSALQNATAPNLLIAIGDSSLFANSTGTANVAIGGKTLKNNTTGAANTAIGTNALSSNITSGFNVAVGTNALMKATSSSNTAIGTTSLSDNTSGAFNTATGVNTLTFNTTGNNNNAFGAEALYSNTTGNGNTAIGKKALWINTVGYSNIAIGNEALRSNTSSTNLIAIGDSSLYNNGSGASTSLQAINNTAVGSKTLFANTTGSDNTATGFHALKENTTGSDNAAYGYSSLISNISGLANTAIGNWAMNNNLSGSYNVAAGVGAMYSNTTGVNNTVVGVDANRENNGSNNSVLGTLSMNNVSGSRNISIGYKAMSGTAFTTSLASNSSIAIGSNALQNANGNYEIAIGDSALYSVPFTLSSNTNVIAVGKNALMKSNGSSNNTAIGHYALSELVTGSGNTAVGIEALKVTTGFSNTASGYQALSKLTTGGGNTAFGSGAMLNNITGANNTIVGFNADVTTSNISTSTAIGAFAQLNASNKVRVGGIFVTVIEGQVGWTSPSDGRFKSNIKEDVPGMQLINLLRPVSYNFETEKFEKYLGTSQKQLDENKEAYASATKIRHSGLVAQELEDALKKLGYSFSGLHTPQNEKDNYGIAYDNFIPIVIKALQELDAKNKKTEKVNDDLRNQLLQLEQKINSLIEKK